MMQYTDFSYSLPIWELKFILSRSKFIIEFCVSESKPLNKLLKLLMKMKNWYANMLLAIT